MKTSILSSDRGYCLRTVPAGSPVLNLRFMYQKTSTYFLLVGREKSA
ncbi:hypothetical protein SUBVAR_05079 [Subdoligranulum variabile DSM 15176]|uniref:Uncharacterized protein n=1 Tax=Subdoligranulum variabile DSM 15176 TaxID=411471 RepID=D1PL45_9FIRM|nr:hypothetical protein SUBVAR_05079 [Subdoligranulum variabile DSM 15176]